MIDNQGNNQKERPQTLEGLASFYHNLLLNEQEFANKNIKETVLGYRYRKPVPKDNLRFDQKENESLIKNDLPFVDSKGHTQFVTIPFSERFMHMVIFGPTGSGKTARVYTPMVYHDMLTRNLSFGNDAGKILAGQVGQLIIDPKGDFADNVCYMGKIIQEKYRSAYIYHILINFRNKLVSPIYDINQETGEMLNNTDGNPIVRGYKLSSTWNYNPNKTYDSDKARQLNIDRNKGAHFFFDFIMKNKGSKGDFPSLSRYFLFIFSQAFEGWLYEKGRNQSWIHDIQNTDPTFERDVVLAFSPMRSNSAYYNPIFGNEVDVVESVPKAILDSVGASMEGSSAHFTQTSLEVLVNAIKVIKRVRGNYANLISLNNFLLDLNGYGEKVVKSLSDRTHSKDSGKPLFSDNLTNENETLISFFDKYFGILTGNDTDAPTNNSYNDSGSARQGLTNILNNPFLRHSLNPSPDETNVIDFDKLLQYGDKLAVGLSASIGETSVKVIGKLFLQQFQSAVMRRPAAVMRQPFFLYVDEFQQYATKEFSELLNQGRSFKVGVAVATQSLDVMEKDSQQGPAITAKLLANTRTKIVIPGIQSATEADALSKMLGESKTTEKSYSFSSGKNENYLLNTKDTFDISNRSTNYSNEKNPIVDPSQFLGGIFNNEKNQDPVAWAHPSILPDYKVISEAMNGADDFELNLVIVKQGMAPVKIAFMHYLADLDHNDMEDDRQFRSQNFDLPKDPNNTAFDPVEKSDEELKQENIKKLTNINAMMPAEFKLTKLSSPLMIEKSTDKIVLTEDVSDWNKELNYPLGGDKAKSVLPTEEEINQWYNENTLEGYGKLIVFTYRPQQFEAVGGEDGKKLRDDWYFINMLLGMDTQTNTRIALVLKQTIQEVFTLINRHPIRPVA